MHDAVKLSANVPLVHYFVQKPVWESAHVYFFAPAYIMSKKHFSRHSRVSLSPKVVAGQSSTQAFVAL